VRISPLEGPLFLVARAGTLWGAWRVERPATYERLVLGDASERPVEFGADPDDKAEPPKEFTIVVAPDESMRVECRDREGRPGIGSFVWVGARNPKDEEHGETVWGGFVTSADGTIELPHAQYWNSLRTRGTEVVRGAGVLWSDEMLGNATRPFPDGSVASLVFDVGSSGVVSLPGLVDPRVAFDDPKVPGERVEVVVPSPKPATQITGRLVDAAGNAMARHEFEAHLERDGVRIEPEEDRLVTDDDGGFAFDVLPGSGGVLHIEVTGTVMGPGPSLSFCGSSHPKLNGRSELARDLSAGVVDVRDVQFVEPR